MTPSDRTKQAWKALKAMGCTNPKTAVRIVQLSEADFAAAITPIFREIEDERRGSLPPGYLATRAALRGSSTEDAPTI